MSVRASVTIRPSPFRARRPLAAVCASALLCVAGASFAADAPPTAPPSPLAPRPAPAPDAGGTLVYGDGWAAVVSVPEGWDSDCCQLAPTHGANLLVFPHDWDHDTPDRVMRLVVWTKPTQSLDADWRADMAAFTARFPGVEAQPLTFGVPGRACRGAVYSGGEAVRNYVVFCDPGNGLDFRYSWSMTLYGENADRGRYENAFRAVVAQTQPMDARLEQRPR